MIWKYVDELIRKSLEEKIIKATEPLSHSQAQFHADKLSTIKGKDTTVYFKNEKGWGVFPIQEIGDVKYSKNSRFGGILNNRAVPFNVIRESVDIIMPGFSIIIPLYERNFLTERFNIHQNAPRYVIGQDFVAMKVPFQIPQNGQEMHNYVLVFYEPIKTSNT